MIRPTLNGQVKLPLNPDLRFEADHFLSLLAGRLERCGARLRREGARIAFEGLRPWGNRKAVTRCEGAVALENQATGHVLRYSLRFRGLRIIAGLAVICFTGIALLNDGKRPLAGYLVVTVGTAVGLLVIEALIVLVWFRWAARRTVRDLTPLPPRAAA